MDDEVETKHEPEKLEDVPATTMTKKLIGWGLAIEKAAAALFTIEVDEEDKTDPFDASLSVRRRKSRTWTRRTEKKAVFSNASSCLSSPWSRRLLSRRAEGPGRDKIDTTELKP
ncbi:hypothetical protein J3R30DRAFT_3702825 [Lentinula aciculospora]|uniref:Uncharacterized protein n=1 Tax=Lentinula aciculospora TaxID=153920 RepID=A0A9W9AAA3_9AGAR|nr:hypothetical protein J3R30DRAFT_3702825 [Lentinula aciculospora]